MTKQILRLLGTATAVAVVATLLTAGRGETVLTVIGHGQHTEGPTKTLTLPGGTTSTVGPLTASFSVGTDHAMCAVGEVGGQVGAFNMLVYATDITSKVSGTDGGKPTYTLAGTARSVTMVGSAVIEDVLTPFTATARDGQQPGARGDYFHITIDTVLWPHTTFGRDVDGNPLAVFAGDVAIGASIAGPGG